MKKLILLFITTSFVLSQNLIWSVDEKYENGNIREISYHQKIWQKIELVKKETYYENGQIWGERNYKDGKRVGKYTYYFSDGQIKKEGNYKDGERYGKWNFYNKDGSIDSVEEPEPINIETLDERDDIYYTQDTNEPYTGAVFGLYPSGEKEGEVYLKDGKIDGKMTAYYKNGQIEVEQNYKDGEKDGKWTFYNEDGSIYMVEEYKDGELVK